MPFALFVPPPVTIYEGGDYFWPSHDQGRGAPGQMGTVYGGTNRPILNRTGAWECHYYGNAQPGAGGKLWARMGSNNVALGNGEDSSLTINSTAQVNRLRPNSGAGFAVTPHKRIVIWECVVRWVQAAITPNLRTGFGLRWDLNQWMGNDDTGNDAGGGACLGITGDGAGGLVLRTRPTLGIVNPVLGLGALPAWPGGDFRNCATFTFAVSAATPTRDGQVRIFMNGVNVLDRAMTAASMPAPADEGTGVGVGFIAQSMGVTHGLGARFWLTDLRVRIGAYDVDGSLLLGT